MMQTPEKKQPTAADEASERALDAIVDIITHLLKSDSPNRFGEAARMCQIGQTLQRAQAKRVQDFAVLDVDDAVEYDQAVGQNFRRNLQNALLPGQPDEREVQRNFMLTFGGNAQVHADAQRATIAQHEAGELQTLLAVLPSVPTERQSIIDTRIGRLIDNMEVRNARPEVVSSDVPRGHSTGEDGDEGDQAQGVRADANGADGNGEVAFACREDAVAG